MKPPIDPAGLKTASAVAGDQSAEYAPYPNIDPADVRQSPPPPPSSSSPKSVTWSSDLVQESPLPLPPPTMRNETGHEATSMPSEANPYITPSPASSSSKITVDSVKNVLGRWGKKLGETAKKTEDLAGNVWQHLKTGPSFADAAMGRIAQGTKIIAEGGYEKIFRQSFDTYPEEQLKSSYACYLSTSAGPVMGSLYLSTAKLAFCSDNPLSYIIEDKTEWSYYKVRPGVHERWFMTTTFTTATTASNEAQVVIPLHQLRVVNPSTSKVNPAEKYIQIVSVDNHEFWFMGFLYYDSAVKHIQEAFTAPDNSQP